MLLSQSDVFPVGLQGDGGGGLGGWRMGLGGGEGGRGGGRWES